MKPVFEKVNCPICTGDNYERLTDKGQYGIKINVSICKNCGFVYLNPRWNKESYDYFYRNEFDKCYRGSSHSQIQPYLTIIERIDKSGYDLKNPDILDIGAGYGDGINIIHERYSGNKKYAIEPSADASESFEEEGIINLDSSIDDWVPDVQCDVIIMRHVLEHFLNPRESLEKVHKCLTENGILYIAVPSLDFFRLPLLTYFFRVVHTMYFNTSHFNWILKDTGLDPVAMHTENNEIYAICKKATPLNLKKPDFNLYEENKQKLEPIIKNESTISYKLKKRIKRLF